METTMKVELNLAERIALMEILPEEGNFITLKIIRDLKSLIGMKETDFKKFGIVQEGDKITWNPEGNKGVEFEIEEKSEEIIRESLEGLNKKSKLAERHLNLYEKFVRKVGEH